MKVLKLVILCCLTLFVFCKNGLAGTSTTMPSDGAVLVFPFYSSGSDASYSTTMTIANSNSVNQIIHIFLVSSGGSLQSCEQLDFYLCIPPNLAKDIETWMADPMISCGYAIVVAVDANSGAPVPANVLSGMATIKAPGSTIFPNNPNAVNVIYNAAAIKAIGSPTFDVSNPDIRKATLRFDGKTYEQIGCLLKVMVAPLTLLPNQTVSPDQTVITVGMSGDLDSSSQTGAGQTAVGVIYKNYNSATMKSENLASFSKFLIGKCQAKQAITNEMPRIAYRMVKFLDGKPSLMKIPIGGGIGLMLTPGGGMILAAEKFLTTSLEIPQFMPPDCSVLNAPMMP